MVDDIINVTCIKCGKDTRHEVVASFDKANFEDSQKLVSETLVCLGCQRIQYREFIISYSEDGVEEKTGADRFARIDYDEEKRPKRFFNCPTNLLNLYEEIVGLLNEKRYRALTPCIKEVINIIIKKAIEKYAKGIKLDSMSDGKKIETLKERKVLSENLADGLSRTTEIIKHYEVYLTPPSFQHDGIVGN